MTIRTLIDDAVRQTPRGTAMKFRAGGEWRSRTYREFGDRIRQAAEVLGGLGVQPRRDNVALLLDNRPEWMEAYAAIAGSGLTAVPIDPKLRAQEVAYILADAEAVAIVAGETHRLMLDEILPQLPALQHVIIVDGLESVDVPCGGRRCLDYETALAQAAAGAVAAGAWFERHRPTEQDVASIIYTSGTTGKPKGAMLTHNNFCSDAIGALDIITDVTPRDSFLIVLPLFHSFSFTANFIVPLCRGCGMSFVESLRSVGDDARVLQPTILMAVPLLAEKMYAKIEDRLRDNRLAQVLLRLGLGRIVGRKVRRTLGGRLRMLLTGGAPCPVHVIRGFRRLGIGMVEGYGLTEASPVVTLSRVSDARPGTIGYKLPNIEVRLADVNELGVGELQVRGPIIMKGYFRNETATREAFDGAWLRTGDLASVDRDGYYSIRGRKKALIVNREGKNIYPEEVEQCIARHPYVLDVVVIGYHEAGDIGEKVGAILAPNMEALVADHNGVEPGWSDIEARMRQIVREQCVDLADYKHPRRIDIRREPLERTSTQKVRRHVYQGQLDVP
jgi:long-chain acyl-CoA synthetase